MKKIPEIIHQLNSADRFDLNEENLGVACSEEINLLSGLKNPTHIKLLQKSDEPDLIHLTGSLGQFQTLTNIPVDFLLLDLGQNRHCIFRFKIPADHSFRELFSFGANPDEYLFPDVYFDHLELAGNTSEAEPAEYIELFYSSLADEIDLQPYVAGYFPDLQLDASKIGKGLNALFEVEPAKAFPEFVESIFSDNENPEIPAETPEPSEVPKATGRFFVQEEVVTLRIETGFQASWEGITDQFKLQEINIGLDLPLNSDIFYPNIFTTGSILFNNKNFRFKGIADPYWKTLYLSVILNDIPSLADWLGKENQLEFFPTSLLELLSFQKAGISAGISLANRSVDMFALELQTHPIHLLEDKFEFTPTLNVRVKAPFDAKARFVNWELSGTARIGDAIQLAGKMAYPNPELSLRITEPVQAQALFDSFFQGVELPEALSISLEEFEIGYAIETKNYHLNCKISDNGHWAYSLGNYSMELKNVGLRLYQQEGEKTYELEAVINLGGTDLLLWGRYQTQAGWTFRTIHSDPLILNDWLVDISSGNLQLPEGLQDFGLSNFDFSFQTKTKAIEIEAASAGSIIIPLGKKDKNITISDLQFSFQKEEQIKAGFSGKTEIKIGVKKSFGFTVQLEYESGKEDTAIWKLDARSIGSLSIVDLMNWIGGAFGIGKVLPDSIETLELSELYFTSTISEESTFRFGGKSEFELAGHPGTIEIGLELSKKAGAYTIEFKGDLLLPDPVTSEPHLFALTFGKGTDSKYMAARYQGELSLQKVVGLFSSDTANKLPVWLNPSMNDVLFLIEKQDAKKSQLFMALEMDLMKKGAIKLSDLEFIGQFIPKDKADLKLKVNFFLATQKVAKKDATRYNDLLKNLNSPLRLPENGIEKVRIETEIEAPLFGDNLKLPVTGPDHPDTTSKTDWKPMPQKHRKLGPVTLHKVGFTMEDGKVKVLLDAGMEMGGFSFNMLGFGVKIPIKPNLDAIKEVEFGLDGLELKVDKGSVRIAGGFYKQTLQLHYKNKLENFKAYAGEARVSVGPKSLTAFGGYVDLHGTPSFFLYAVALLPLGGPAEFFIDGFAGGFGLNSSLNIPAIEGVRNFIMVRSAFGEQYFDDEDQESSLSRVFKDIPPTLGKYWIALGIKANHYKFIESFMLAAVVFGDKLEIELLGLARLKLPKGAEAMAKAELAIHAHIVPEDGTLAMDARITDGSYIFNPMAKLSGGFAFYSWFSGPHAGDFVISLGGYHPKFKKPDHYPSVPRLSLNYQVKENIYVKGSAYFALTPKMLMAGGRLEGQADLGIIQAWFVAEAHFLMNFQPFEYFITASVTIGATITVDLGLAVIRKTIQLGADMAFWGPNFGGRVTVDLAIVDFTINFGAPMQLPKPVSWSVFRTELLPPEHEITRVMISEGVVRELKSESFGPDNVRFIVNPGDLRVRVESNIPAREFALEYLDQTCAGEIENWELGIGPMALGHNAFRPRLSLSFKKYGHDQESGKFNRSKSRCLTNPVPAALWGKFMDRELGGESLIGKRSSPRAFDQLGTRKEDGLLIVPGNTPLTGLEFEPEKESASATEETSLAKLLTPTPEKIPLRVEKIQPIVKALSKKTYEKIPVLEMLSAPDQQIYSEIKSSGMFGHLPEATALTFRPGTGSEEGLTQTDLDQFEDPPILSSLGAQKNLIPLNLKQLNPKTA